jgi:hypothetical protein
MVPHSECGAARGVWLLVLVNVALQVLDGSATYIGLRAGLAEGNPLVAWAMASLGAAQGLVLIKLLACTGVLTVWSLRRSRLAAPALVFTAAIYAACSLAPWAAVLAQAHLDM